MRNKRRKIQSIPFLDAYINFLKRKTHDTHDLFVKILLIKEYFNMIDQNKLQQ